MRARIDSYLERFPSERAEKYHAAKKLSENQLIQLGEPMQQRNLHTRPRGNCHTASRAIMPAFGSAQELFGKPLPFRAM